MYLDKKFMAGLLEQAEASERKRVACDLRNSTEDGSQRMLNAMMPETVMPVHRHHDSNETVAVLMGSLTEMFYEEFQVSSSKFQVRETARFELGVGDVLQIPKDVWHSLRVNEPTVILEAKDGAYHPLREDEVM